MFTTIKIILGLLLFCIGINIHPTLFALGMTMLGCYFLSRPIAFEYGSGPGYFIMGAMIMIPVFFLAVPFCQQMPLDAYLGEVFRFTLCLVSGVFSFLSIKK